MSRPAIRRPRGFTLMELLVVLVITALLMSMLFQSLAIFRRAQERIDVRTLSERQTELAERWFDEAVAGLYPWDTQTFVGDDDHWQGYTLQPIQGTPGAPVAVRWNLHRDLVGNWLAYTVAGKPAVEFRLPDGELHFSYVDEAGQSHRQWPPAKGLFPALPAAIALVDGSGSALSLLRYSAVRGPRRPYVEPFEPEQE